LIAAAADGRPSAEQALERREELQALQAALDALPDDARETVLLYYREGHSVAQVAALLGLSSDAVKQRLSRARAKLQQSLLDRAGDLARRSAPGAAFTLAVVAAIDAGVSATATAAALTLARPVASGLFGLKLAALVGLPLAGLAIGAGVWVGTHERPGSSEPVVATDATLAKPSAIAAATAALIAGAPVAQPSQSAAQRSPASPASGSPASFAAGPPPRKTSGFNKDTIWAALDAVKPAVKACYESALVTDPSLAGKVVVKLRLLPGEGSARVAHGEVSEAETHSPDFEACVLAKAEAASFPNPDLAEGATVTYPFLFDPGGGFGGPPQN
jgi:hypothetical protein